MVGIITILVMALLTAGVYLSFYLPLIPYITWINGVIKWLVVVIESLIAAPIWAAAHVHPDGDEQVGRAGPGYMIILGVFMRPTLMLFGLIIAIVAAQPMAHFINMTFMTAIQGSMTGSTNGITAILAYVVLYGFLMTIMLHSLFGLINWLPDNVLRWIGNAVGAHGIADREGDKVDHAFMAIATKTTHGLRPGGKHGGDSGNKPAPKGTGGDSGGGGGGGGGSGQSNAQNDIHQTLDTRHPSATKGSHGDHTTVDP